MEQSPSDLIDTHCHLNHREFDEDRREVLERARNVGVNRLLVIGFDLASSRFAVSIAEEFDLWAAVGIHPESADEWSAETSRAFGELYRASDGRIRAYGEMGLDYHWDTQPHDVQQRIFAEQITFARSLSPSLPLIIHNRDAHADVLAVIRETASPAPVVMHCFTGGIEEAKANLDAGCYLGIGGVATFKKSVDLREAITFAPLDRLLLETDCPYLAPQSHRGRRNEPSYMPEIAAIVATARGMTVKDVALATSANALELFEARNER